MSALRLVADALDPNEERIVMLAVSRLIGEMEGWRSYTYNLCRIIAALDGLDAQRGEDGQLREVPFRDGKQEMLNQGWSPEHLDRLWVAAQRQKRPLDREVVSAFVPEWLWPSVLRLIERGSEETIEEAREIFSCWASGLFANGEERPEGKRAVNNLNVYISALWALMRRLCDLRESAPKQDREHFEGWVRYDLPKQPSAEEFNAEESNRDRSAPPLLSVRRALKGICAEIERKKTRSHWRKSMFEELRDRAVLGCLALYGMRAEALWRLDVDHFIREHTFPDGSVGAALVVPRVKRERVEHTKFMPSLVAEWIEEYLDYIDAKPGEPMWRPRGKARSQERLTQQTFTDILIRTLSPYCDGRIYSPHTLRHLASSLATLVGIEWIRERPAEFLLGANGTPSSPQTFSDILLGHALHHIADRYRDMDSKASREAWTKITVEGAWEWLWGDKGARKGPDLQLIAAAEQTVARARVEKRGLEAQLDGLEQQARRAKALTEKEGIGLVLDILTASRALAEANARFERAVWKLDEARAVLVPIDDTASEVPQLEESELQLVTYEDEAERELIRMKLLPDEFRWAVGADILPKSTLRRWMSGKLPHPAGDRRNLFDPPLPGAKYPEVVEVASAHKRYIRVDKLDPDRFHVDAWERIMELCRRPEPKRPSKHSSRREATAEG